MIQTPATSLITTSSLVGPTTESQSTPPPWSACSTMSGMPGSLMYLSWCTAGESHHKWFSISRQLLYTAPPNSLFTAPYLYAHDSSPHQPAPHCSAGVGRTGTFIALDITLDQMNAEKTVDIKGTVQRMREKRMNMIQTSVSASGETDCAFWFQLYSTPFCSSSEPYLVNHIIGFTCYKEGDKSGAFRPCVNKCEYVYWSCEYLCKCGQCT